MKKILNQALCFMCAIVMIASPIAISPTTAYAAGKTTYTYTFDYDKTNLHSIVSNTNQRAVIGSTSQISKTVILDGLTITWKNVDNLPRLGLGSFKNAMGDIFRSIGNTANLSTTIDAGSKYITEVAFWDYNSSQNGWYVIKSETNRAHSYSTVINSDCYVKLVVTVSDTLPEKPAGSGSVSLDDWTYGETAKAPVPSSDTNGTGNVTYQYFTDADCTKKTTNAKDGAYTSGKVPKNIGTYWVKATFAETDTYKAVTATDSFTIRKASASYTAPAAESSLRYSGADQALVTGGTVNVPRGGSILYSLSKDGDYSASIPTGKDAGEYTVWYKIDGNSNVAGVNPQSIPVTIAKRDVTLTSSSDSKPYDGTALTKSGVEVSGDGFITGEGAEYTVTGSQTNAGTSKNIFIYALKNGTNSENYNIKTVYGDLTVAGADAAFTAPTAKTGLTYNGNAQPLVNAGSIDANAGQVEYSLDDSSYAAEIPTAKKAGTYKVYYKVTGTNGNYTYDGTSGSLDVTIERKAVKVSGITAADKTYDGTTAAAVNTDDAVLTGKVKGDSLTVSAAGSFRDANAGEGKTVSISGLTLGGSDAGNYFLAKDGQQAETTAAIEPREADLTWSESSFIYDGETHQISAEVSNKALESDTFAIEYLNSGNQKVSAADAGNYTATVTSLGNDNYTLSDSEKTKEWSINYLDVSDASITGTQGGGDWYVSPVSLTAPEGCTIKTSDGEQWQDSVTFTEDGNTAVTYRVKNADGQISGEKTAAVRIDTAPPQGEITIQDNVFKTFLNTVTFGLLFENHVDVTVSGSDDVSGIKDISYYKSAEAMTEEDVKALADDQWTSLGAESSGTFAVDGEDQCVVYGRITDNAGHITCISSDGMVVSKKEEVQPQPVQPQIDPNDTNYPNDPINPQTPSGENDGEAGGNTDADTDSDQTGTDGSGTIDGSGVNPKSPETAQKTVDVKLSSKGKTSVKFTPASGKDAATSFKFKARKDGSFTFKIKGMTSATVRLRSASGKVLVTENLKSLKSNSGISTTYVGLRSGKSYSIEVTKADLAEGQTECTATASNPGGTGRSYFRKALIKAKIGETYRIQNSSCKKFSQTFKVKATRTGTLKIQPLDNRGWAKIYTSGGKKLLFNGRNKGISHQQYRVTKGKTYRIVFTAHPVKNSHYDVGFRYKS